MNCKQRITKNQKKRERTTEENLAIKRQKEIDKNREIDKYEIKFNEKENEKKKRDSSKKMKKKQRREDREFSIPS